MSRLTHLPLNSPIPVGEETRWRGGRRSKSRQGELIGDPGGRGVGRQGGVERQQQGVRRPAHQRHHQKHGGHPSGARLLAVPEQRRVWDPGPQGVHEALGGRGRRRHQRGLGRAAGATVLSAGKTIASVHNAPYLTENRLFLGRPSHVLGNQHCTNPTPVLKISTLRR